MPTLNLSENAESHRNQRTDNLLGLNIAGNRNGQIDVSRKSRFGERTNSKPSDERELRINSFQRIDRATKPRDKLSHCEGLSL